MIRPLLLRALGSEGQPRPGPWQLPITGGWLPANVGDKMNWWQCGYDPVGGSNSAIVEACISAYAETVAMCPGDHWRQTDDGGRDQVSTSALSRILRKPNDYDSISDFMLNATRSLYMYGNAYALALRNNRFEVSELHLMDARQSRPEIAQTGDIFYRLSGNDIINRRIQSSQLVVPARDVLHIRLATDRDSLIGVSPLQSVAMDMMTSGAINNQQIQFYTNQARPSFILTTDMVIDKDQVDQLRDRWNEQARGLNAGGTPILTAGLKPVPISTTPLDSQLADMMKLSDQHIALAFRIPLQILGISGAGGQYSSTELLMQAWIASGLGFCLNHIEEAIGLFFGLEGVPWEYVEFDTSALLRSSFKERIESLARAVQGGIMAPNEARAKEDYGAVPFGDEPRVQQQVVPLSAAGKIPAAPGAPPAPPAPSGDEPPPPDAAEEVPAKQETTNDLVERLRTAQARHYRNSFV
jgi:HK97 family phage portal protein